MPAIDRAALAAEDAVTDRYKEAPWRFGVEHEMALNPVEHGAWTVEQGHRVWRLALAAEGATSMSLRFDTYRVPKGGQLFVYAADGSDVLGALDHRNMKDWGGLAVGVIAADEVVVEYRQPLSVVEMPELNIDQVVQGYRALSGWPMPTVGRLATVDNATSTSTVPRAPPGPRKNAVWPSSCKAATASAQETC